MIKKLLLTLAVVLGIGVVSLAPVSVGAVDVFEACKGSASDSSVCKSSKGDSILGSNGILKKVIDLLLMVVGIVSVIMIIVGGLRYVLSNGDQSQVSAAKNTILYSVVGLVVAILSFAIVGFVLDRVG